MLTGRNKDTAAAYEPNAFVESAGCGRSELKNPATDIDSVSSAIEDFDETVFISRTGRAAAPINLADHDLISCTWRRSWCRCRSRSWRRRWSGCWSGPAAANRSFPHAAPMRSNAQNPIRILNLHVKDSHPRQSCSEWIPRCAAIRRVVDADVRAGKKIVGVQWINRERIDGNAGDAAAGSCPHRGAR